MFFLAFLLHSRLFLWVCMCVVLFPLSFCFGYLNTPRTAVAGATTSWITLPRTAALEWFAPITNSWSRFWIWWILFFYWVGVFTLISSKSRDANSANLIKRSRSRFGGRCFQVWKITYAEKPSTYCDFYWEKSVGKAKVRFQFIKRNRKKIWFGKLTLLNYKDDYTPHGFLP